jgi:hypothetical protein
LGIGDWERAERGGDRETAEGRGEELRRFPQKNLPAGSGEISDFSEKVGDLLF